MADEFYSRFTLSPYWSVDRQCICFSVYLFTTFSDNGSTDFSSVFGYVFVESVPRDAFSFFSISRSDKFLIPNGKDADFPVQMFFKEDHHMSRLSSEFNVE